MMPRNQRDEDQRVAHKTESFKRSDSQLNNNKNKIKNLAIVTLNNLSKQLN
jgi:hypothetical protein